jgi:cytoplasmic iron level regulating protein YaaA (DUF328/UPF0246 family)
MLVLLSPAKTLDFNTPWRTEFTTPALLERSQALIDVLRRLSADDLQSLMGVSRAIAELNVERYRDFALPLRPERAKPALLAFKGDTYRDLPLAGYSAEDYAFAQRHLRILSGLYGVLRPLDLILPYRLEMGTRLGTSRGSDLYAFWGDTLTEHLSAALREQGDRILLNCASDEYFASVRPERLDGRVVKPVFKDYKGGTYKVISFFAKRARGAMAHFVVKGRVSSVEALRSFEDLGYRFAGEESRDDQLVFLRRS